MEDKRTAITNRQGLRKKIHPLVSSISIGGDGGIAGLFVFGGALAIAGFMVVGSFASKKHKAKGTHDDHQPKPKPKPQKLLLEEHGCKTEEDHDTTQSLTSLIQHGDATCCWASNMSTNQVNDSSELLSAQSLILEDRSELKQRSVEKSPTDFHHQEIVFSDSSHPESAASSNEGELAEECMMSLFNSPSGQDEEPQDDLTSSETETETETEDDDIDVDDDDDDDDHMLSDDVSEIGEEDSSKFAATGTTSLEPVWPAELIQHAKQKLKGDSHVCCDSDVDGSNIMTVANQATMNQNLNFFMAAPDNQPLTTWVFPFLLLALLLSLVLLTRRSQESFYVLDEDTSVVKRI